ncbi:hypothetical protein NIES298_20800 [Microcystis aeruginosa NIES-298]|nr:MAG: hypothetical protein BEV12_02675 [Microcystis aeruginosa CACIAM 03]GBE97832.1 hypothetical protein NIES298_20800 [Microcystis aeruginosa NIES-298]
MGQNQGKIRVFCFDRANKSSNLSLVKFNKLKMLPQARSRVLWNESSESQDNDQQRSPTSDRANVSIGRL